MNEIKEQLRMLKIKHDMYKAITNETWEFYMDDHKHLTICDSIDCGNYCITMIYPSYEEPTIHLCEWCDEYKCEDCGIFEVHKKVSDRKHICETCFNRNKKVEDLVKCYRCDKICDKDNSTWDEDGYLCIKC